MSCNMAVTPEHDNMTNDHNFHFQACKDLKKYCTDHQNEDFLIKGFASQKQNPFREKSSCAVL